MYTALVLHISLLSELENLLVSIYHLVLWIVHKAICICTYVYCLQKIYGSIN